MAQFYLFIYFKVVLFTVHFSFFPPFLHSTAHIDKIDFHGECPESQSAATIFLRSNGILFVFVFFFFVLVSVLPDVVLHQTQEPIPICVSFIRFTFHCFKCAHNLYRPLFRLPLNMHLHNLFFSFLFLFALHWYRLSQVIWFVEYCCFFFAIKRSAPIRNIEIDACMYRSFYSSSLIFI